LDEFGFSQRDYEDYAAVYKNIVEILKKDKPENPDDPIITDDYDLVAFNKFKIDFEYIVELLQGFVDFLRPEDEDFDETEFEHKLLELREIVKEYAEDNPGLSSILMQVLDEIESNKTKFMGQDMSVIINQMRYKAIDKEIEKFATKWFIDFEDVKYEAYNFKDGELANENKLKENADYAAYKAAVENALPKFKFNGALIRDFKDELMPIIAPLIG
jgi:type I restriction enzyme R subunit